MAFNTRSKAASNVSAQGYVPLTNPGVEQISHKVTSTLDHMKTLLDELEPVTPFEKGMKSYMTFLHCQFTELKHQVDRVQSDSVVRYRNTMETVDELALSCIKTEQYSRRDTVTVVGLAQPENETQPGLTKKVAEVLSTPGDTVTEADLSVVHRNSNRPKIIKGKTIPPSVTVKFCRIDTKDRALRAYKNFDTVQKRPREVKVYQSLTPHYSSLRGTIYKFLNSKPNDGQDFGRICNNGLSPKWVTYQSPTSGLAIKLSSGEYFTGIHTFDDFVKCIWDKFPNCRVGN